MFPIKIRQVHVNSTIPKYESQLKTWLIICFQNKFIFFFFSFHTCHTWGLINIKMLSHSIRISSWLRRNSPALRRKTISSRLIDLSLYQHRDYFLPCDGFFYIESAPGYIFSTQTRSADISSKINCWEWLVQWKRNQNVSRHLAACQLPQSEQCGSSVFPGIYKD